MSRPITLWKPDSILTSDDAGTTIVKYALPPPNKPGPYERVPENRAREPLLYIPSLKCLCIQKLVEYPDQLDTLGPTRLHYRPPTSHSDYDLVRALIPGFSHKDTTDGAFLTEVDPRLWAVLIQTVSPLPETFRAYTIPLSDVHVPLLQQIRSTPDFSLITTLELRGMRNSVNDDTIGQLGQLHTLAALDLSESPVTSWGIKRLCDTLIPARNSEIRRGPWGLRMLYLRDCTGINDAVYEVLDNFPLLSVVDLRGTRCRYTNISSRSFRPIRDENQLKLFHPFPLMTSLDALVLHSSHTGPGSIPTVFSHPKPYIVHIPIVHHKAPTSRPIPSYDISRRFSLSRASSRDYHRDDWMRWETCDPAGGYVHMEDELENGGMEEGDEHESDHESAQDDEPSLAIIAGEAARAEASRRALLDFYRPLYPPMLKALPSSESSSISAATAIPPKLHPLMLFRPPPPYNLIETPSSLPINAAVRRPMKRSQPEYARHGEKVRQSKKAKASIDAVQSLIRKKAEVTPLNHSRHVPAPEARRNPFARRSKSEATEDSMPFEIDPDLIALSRQNKPQPRSSLTKLPRQFQSNEPAVTSSTAKAENVSRTRAPPSLPIIDPDLLASVEADRRKGHEKRRQKETKTSAEGKGKRRAKLLSHSDSDLSQSDSGMKEDHGSPPALIRSRNATIRLLKPNGPPKELKPLTTHSVPHLPPELRRKGYTEAERAKLLGIKESRRKSECSKGLKQATLAGMFVKPSSATSGAGTSMRRAASKRPRPSV